MGWSGDIYSGIDTQRRKLAGLVDDPFNGDIKKAIQEAKDGGGAQGKDTISALLKGDFAKQRTLPPDPSIYKVDLPDSAISKMLDWDKPLSEQSPEIQAIAAKRIAELKAGGAYDHFFPDDPTGQWLHKAIGPQLQGEGGGMFGAEAAAQNLQKLGIPGIKYLDGGSRDAGTGTSNYVIFPKNEGILTILERNGVPVK